MVNILDWSDDYATGIAAFVACVVVAFTPMKQGLHDMIASTLVVKK